MNIESRTQAAAGLPLLVVLLGPTASGKTSLSLALGERFGGEIVSCDSVAVYRGLDLGSAKPGASERARVPHHMIDIVAADQLYTAGDYSRDARAAIAAITARGRLPIVTGGTGLYLRALLLGLFAGPPRRDALRARLRRSRERLGPGWLHRLLTRLDPPAAGAIHPNDTSKLIRAIEVCVSAGRPLSAAWGAGRDPLRGYRVLRIGLDPARARLYPRIDARCAEMFASGLVEETRSLLARYGDRPVLSALGYRQAAALLRGELDPVQALAAARQGHRNYAKRQMTWFRREPDVCWIEDFGDAGPAISAAGERVAENLAGQGELID
jgi:tRNA dimethylallyltransferase